MSRKLRGQRLRSLSGPVSYDMMYGAEPTAFMRWAASKTPWAVSDGLGMLVEQAAESYFLWLGKRPNTRRVIQALRLQLSL